MRLIPPLLSSALALLSGAPQLPQVWEKPVAPGLMFRMEVDPSVPRVIRALRFTPGSPVRAVAQLAGGTVYESTPSKGRGTVSELVRESGGIAGVNGDFFPYTGDPLGAMVRDGELLSIPTLPRASFGWTNTTGGGATGIMRFTGVIRTDSGEVPIDNLNAECGLNQVVVDTASAGTAIAKAPNVVVLARLAGRPAPGARSDATVESILSDQTSMPLQGDQVAIIAHGNKAARLTSLRQGDRITLDLRASGFEWSRADQMIGGGPYLVRGGKASVDADAERFKADLVAKRHPRTAIGKTAEGDLWFVCVDGRQKMSDGATLSELAEIMRALGCREAINLDGGGSTDLNVLGIVANRPSDGVERPVANGVVFIGPRADVVAGDLKIDGPATLDKEITLTASLNGAALANADVIWSAQGAAWIDQAGLLRALGPGVATVTIYARGKIASRQITVSVPKAP